MDEMLITLTIVACFSMLLMAAYTRRSAYVACLAAATIMSTLTWLPGSASAKDEPAGSGSGSDFEEPAFLPPGAAEEEAAARKRAETNRTEAKRAETKRAETKRAETNRAETKRPAPGTVHPDGAVELSIRPRTEVGAVTVEVHADSPRPAWIDAEKETSKDGSVRIAVSSGPHSRIRETRMALREEAERAVRDHIDDHLAASNAVHWLRVFVGEKYNLKNLTRKHIKRSSHAAGSTAAGSFSAAHKEDIPPLYKEELVVSVGDMHQWHTRLEFDDRFHRDLNADWQTVKATSRLMQFGFIGASLLGALGLLLGFFKADTATRGAHTRRLIVTTVVAVAGLIAAGVLVSRWIPWM